MGPWELQHQRRVREHRRLQVLCPLICTTEKTTITDNIQFGERLKPMVFFFMCDNNGIYPMTFQLGVPSGDNWGQTAAPYTGTYYGLMVINEAPIVIIDNNNTNPTVQGAVFGGCPGTTRIPPASPRATSR